MHLRETAEDLAGLLEAGLLDRVQLTAQELHRVGVKKYQLNRELASAGVLKSMYHCIADLEVSRRQNDRELRRLLVWRHRASRFGLRWAFTPFVRARQARLRCINSDMAFLSEWTGQIQAFVRKSSSGPIPGAVCVLREAARSSRRGQSERCEKLRQRAVEKYGQDEVDYVDEAFRLCYTALPKAKAEPPRVKSGFAY